MIWCLLYLFLVVQLPLSNLGIYWKDLHRGTGRRMGGLISRSFTLLKGRHHGIQFCSQICEIGWTHLHSSHWRSDFRKLNGNNSFILCINLVIFCPVTTEFTTLERVLQVSIITGVCFTTKADTASTGSVCLSRLIRPPIRLGNRPNRRHTSCYLAHRRMHSCAASLCSLHVSAVRASLVRSCRSH